MRLLTFKNILQITFLLAVSVLVLESCYKEKFDTSGNANLRFSADTLRFDTVFTELGSATRSIRVYNDSDLPIIIDRISLEGAESTFRMNADGIKGKTVEHIEVPGKDSIWVFFEVTVDPDQDISVSPFVIEEKVNFLTNGNEQFIRLEAWGQNANYLPNRFHQNGIAILSCDLQSVTWDDPKPYVIYGTLLVDSCTVILPAGARVYVHGGIANNDLGIYNDGIIYFLPEGKLLAEGTSGNPVLIQDDRLEQEYAGLWGGIRFGPGSGPHEIKNTKIYNSTIAVVADSASTLTMEAVEIGGTSSAGLFARHANVRAENCLFYSNGSAGVALTYGGEYSLDYCTIANFGNDAAGLVINNFFCTDPLCLEEIRLNKVTSTIRNSIIVGSNGDEIQLTDASEEGMGFFDYSFDHCLIRINKLTDDPRFANFRDNCLECIDYNNSDTLFVNPDEYDFHLDTLSVAEEQARVLPGIPFDFDGNLRDPFAPDLGCYEYLYE